MTGILGFHKQSNQIPAL